MSVTVNILGTNIVWPTKGDVDYSVGTTQFAQFTALALAPTSGLYNTTNATVGNLSYSNTGELLLNGVPVGGSGGTPAGSSTQIQYNTAGAFDASANFTWDNSTSTLALASATTSTITTSYKGAITAGNSAIAAGGSLTFTSGNSTMTGTGTNARGGNLTLLAGNSTNTRGGVINITAGSCLAVTGTQTGGALNITAGTGPTGGGMTIRPGTGVVGKGGNLTLLGGNGLIAGGDTSISGGYGSDVTSQGGNLFLNGGISGDPTVAGGYMNISTAPNNVLVERIRIDKDGTWILAGNPGIAGQVLTSQGPGLPPIWV
jgi:hypothetical protein